MFFDGKLCLSSSNIYIFKGGETTETNGGFTICYPKASIFSISPAKTMMRSNPIVAASSTATTMAGNIAERNVLFSKPSMRRNTENTIDVSNETETNKNERNERPTIFVTYLNNENIKFLAYYISMHKYFYFRWSHQETRIFLPSKY